ncbi:MAG TPA: ABC transporter substrate-binding protein [Casimicrobiaceae bacterium]|jgi:NitT/TauT family transport system substrate-binding protein|nr:ABC transporter substrate-binding protein [Casimicrobiaceae bacterium]
MRLIVATLVFATTLLSMPGKALAEVGEIRVARQFGLSFLPLVIMQDLKLFEKHVKQAGLGEVKLTSVTFGSGAMMNDALLSGSLDFASAGVAPVLTLWARTKGNIDVKAVCAIAAMPNYLNTRNPNVKSVRDFTDKDRIALPAIKVSGQAVTLQIVAEQVFGQGNHTKLDPITISLSDPDAVTILLSGAGEINSHFSNPPFAFWELDKPEIHTVLNSYDVIGPHSILLLYTNTKFRESNPKTYAAFFSALQEATAFINGNKKAAAEIYLRASKDRTTMEDVMRILNDPTVEYTLTPKNIMKFADFMYKVGSIKEKPSSWRDLFFPEAHGLPGS